MSTQAPEATGSPAGTEGTPQAGDASTTPEPTASGAGSQDTGDTGSTTTETAPAADHETPKVIAALRNDFKSERTTRQQAEQQIAEIRAQRDADAAEQAKRMDAFAIALGLKSGDEPPDPAKLAEELERTRESHKSELERQAAEIRQRDLRLAVLTQAPSLEANGLLLMDSMSFLRKLDGLDPAADDFSERVGDAIKAAAEANAQYRLAPPAPAAAEKPTPTIPRSGGEHNGAPGGNRQWNIEDVGRASAAEVAKAQEDGLLIDLGFSPKKTRR